MSSDPVVILSYARTPMGSFQGALAGASATELGATAIRAAVERAGVAPDQIDKAFIGCVLPAGLGQAPARQAAIGAGLPPSVEATTVNKVCGSGMQAAIFAHDMIAAGSADVVVAVAAPLPKVREGAVPTPTPWSTTCTPVMVPAPVSEVVRTAEVVGAGTRGSSTTSRLGGVV